MYGSFKWGFIKITEGQIKKHRSQMSMDELSYLSIKLRRLNIKNLEFSKHFERKLKRFTNNNLSDLAPILFEIESILNRKDIVDLIVEYNENKNRNDRRVLLRGDNEFSINVFDKRRGKSIKVKANLCIVVNIDKPKLITFYWNKVNDNHLTLDEFRYNKDLKIIRNDIKTYMKYQRYSRNRKNKRAYKRM